VKAGVVALIFVVVVAARGARAQSVDLQTSVGFRQCLERCEALLGGRATHMDGDQISDASDFIHSDVGGPNRECFLCGIEGLDLQVRALDHFFGGLMPRAQPTLHALAFDPAD